MFGSRTRQENKSGWKKTQTRQFNLDQDCLVNSLFSANDPSAGVVLRCSGKYSRATSMWVQLRSYSGYFAKNMVLALLFGDKFSLPNFPDLRRQFNDGVIVRCLKKTKQKELNQVCMIWVVGQKERRPQSIGYMDSFHPWDSRRCSRKCHRPDRHRSPHVLHVGELFL